MKTKQTVAWRFHNDHNGAIRCENGVFLQLTRRKAPTPQKDLIYHSMNGNVFSEKPCFL